MKLYRKILITVIALFTVAIATSCIGLYDDDGDGYLGKYTLVLNFGDGRASETVTVRKGETLTIERPTREGYDFVGWCTDEELTNFADFERPITKDLTLYAKWTFDHKSLLELVSNEAAEKCVKIISGNGAYSSSQGSGVIYKRTSYFCYVLTNSHVVTNASGNPNFYNKIYDVYGDEHAATVIKNDPSCDLAVLRFNNGETRFFRNLEIEDRIPNKSEELVMVSVPNGKYNTVTLGDVMWYGRVEKDKDIDFEVLWIEGEIDHGSSGGAVLDADMNIVGILYAVASDEDGEEKYALAIPAPKIVEFLSDIEY